MIAYNFVSYVIGFFFGFLTCYLIVVYNEKKKSKKKEGPIQIDFR